MTQEEDKIRKVGDDTLGSHRVSTVLLKFPEICDPGWPFIYETMIFYKDSWVEIYTDHYATLKKAEEGHQKAIKWLKDNK